MFVGSGKLGLPEAALCAFALGCDIVSVGREAMLSIGCIQAQRCHTGRCPVGVATQSRWLARGLDPELKSVRFATYLRSLRGEILALARACGEPHPALVTPDHLEIVGERFGASTLQDVFGYEPDWGRRAAGAPRGDRGADALPGGLARAGPGAGPGARGRDRRRRRANAISPHRAGRMTDGG